MVVIPCPSAHDLERFLLGRTIGEEAQRVEEHLAACAACLKAAQTLRLHDPLLDTVQSVAIRPDDADDQSGAALRQRLRDLPAGLGSSPDETAADQPVAIRPIRDATQELYDFLAPPQGPGELGRLGTYRALRILGSGGMGVVFEAEDLRLKRRVALKAMRPSLVANEGARQRFLREAEATAAVRSDHVITIYQVDQDRGVPFLAMELLEGAPLDRWLEQHQPTLAQVLHIGRQMAAGLAAAHARGLIHRDIKPGNIWLETRGEPGALATGERVKLLDFGLARAVADDTHLTQTGAIVGTPAYMAPEQARGDKIDHRSDLFSLGSVLYRMCSGNLPFRGESTMAVLTSLALDEPKPLRELRPDLPPTLCELVTRLLAKKPEDRPASAQAVEASLAALERRLGPQPLSHAAAFTPEFEAHGGNTAVVPAVAAAALPKRRRRLASVAVLLLAGLGVAGWFVAASLIRVPTPRGTLVIQADDPNVEIVVKHNGAVIQDRTAKREIELTVGDYEIELAEVKEGLRLSTRKFSIHRDGRETVRVWLEKPEPAVATLDRLDPAQIPAEERFDWQPRELVAVLGEHRQRLWSMVRSLAVSPDGKQLVIGDLKGLVHFWDAGTLCEESTHRPVPAHVTCHLGTLALSRDGKRLACSYMPGGSFVSVVDMTDPQHKALWTVETGEGIYELAFSPDGKTLAGAAGWGKELLLWDVAGPVGGKPRTRLEGCGSPAFAPDGKTLACLAGKERRAVRLYDLTGESPKEKGALPLKAGGTAVVFLPDGRLVTGSADNTLRLWDVSARPPVEKAAAGAEGPLLHLAAAPAGQGLAWGEGSGVTLWSTAGDRFEKRWAFELGGTVSNVLVLAFSPDGRALYTGSLNGAVRAWDVSGASAKEKTPCRMDRSYCDGRLLPSPDGRLLGCSSGDRVGDAEHLRLWDLGGAAPQEVELPDAPMQCWPLAFSPDGHWLLGGEWWHSRLWALAPDKAPELVSAALPGAAAGAFDPQGKTLALPEVAADRIGLWDLQGNKPREHAAAPSPKACRSLAFTPDGKGLVAGPPADDQVVRAYAVGDRGLTERFQIKPAGQFRCVALAPDGKTVALSDTTDSVSFWRITGDKPERQEKLEGLLCSPLSVAYSPDGKALATSDEHGNVIVWDAQRRTKQWDCKLPGAVSRVAFAAGGRHLLTLNGNGTIYVLRLTPAPGKAPPQRLSSPLDKLEPAKLPAPTDRYDWRPPEMVALLGQPADRHWAQARMVALRPDGKQIASAGDDGTVRLWDMATCHQQAVFRFGPDADGARGLAYVAGGKRLAVASGRGLKFWDVSGATPAAVPAPAGLPDNILHMVITPDERTVALRFVDDRHSLGVWDLSGEKARRRLRLDELPDADAPFALSGDGRVFAMAGQKRARLWDLGGAEAKERVAGVAAESPLGALALTADGRRLATAGPGFQLRLWDVSDQTARELASQPYADELIAAANHLAFTPDGKYLLAAQQANWLLGWQVFRIEPGRLVRQAAFGGHVPAAYGGQVPAAALAPDGRTLIACWGGALRYWSVGSAPPREVRPFDLPSYQSSPGIIYGGQEGPGLWATADGARLVSQAGDWTCRLWDLGATPPQATTIRRPDGRHEVPLALAADGHTLATVGHGPEGESVVLWDLTATPPRRKAVIPGHGRAAFTPDGKRLAVNRGERVELWDLTADPPLVKARFDVKVGPGEMAFSSDGLMLACVCELQVEVWDVRTSPPSRKTTLKDKEGHPRCLAFAPDRPVLAVAQNQAVILWDLGGPEPQRRADWQCSEGHAVSFSPDGRSLIVCEANREVAVWDVAATPPRRRWAVQSPGTLHGATFAADSRHLYTLNGNGTIAVLRLPPAPPPLDEAWIKATVALPADRQVQAVADELKKRNPGFDGQLQSDIDLGKVVELRFATNAVEDISPLSVLTGLKRLSCTSPERKGKLAELSPLFKLRLETLDISGNPVANLAALSGMPLKELNCSRTRLVELSALRGLPLVDLFTDCDPHDDEGALQSIGTLRQINGQPAGQVLKRRD